MKKSIIIILHQDASPQEKTLLQKICAAVGLDLENEVGLIHKPNPSEISFLNLKKSFQPKKVIVFGVPPKILSLNIAAKAFVPVMLNDCEVLFVPGLDRVMADQTIKKSLWSALQKSFNLK